METATNYLSYKVKAENAINHFSKMLYDLIPCNMHSFRDRYICWKTFEDFKSWIQGALDVRDEGETPVFDVHIYISFNMGREVTRMFSSFDEAKEAFVSLQNAWRSYVQITFDEWGDKESDNRGFRARFLFE